MARTTKSGEDVEGAHERNQLSGNLTDPLDATDDDEPDEEGHKDPGVDSRQAETVLGERDVVP